MYHHTVVNIIILYKDIENMRYELGLILILINNSTTLSKLRINYVYN